MECELRAARKVWFDDVCQSVAFAETELEPLVQAIATAVFAKTMAFTALPAILMNDKSPRILFISVSDTNSQAHVLTGTGMGIIQAAQCAIEQIEFFYKNYGEAKWLKIDVVQEVGPLQHIAIKNSLNINQSLEGIAFAGSGNIAFIAEQLLAYTLVNKRGKIRRKNIINYLQKFSHLYASRAFESIQKLFMADRIKLHTFRTASYFAKTKKIVSLYRGHDFFKRLTSQVLLEAVNNAGQYLVNAVGEGGKFVYSYFPKKNEVAEKYNILRHAGTIYAMLELYEVTHSSELLTSAAKALEYLLLATKIRKVDAEKMACVVEEGFVKLGGNALAAIALAKYINITNEQRHVQTLRQLGKWIQSVQRETGEFYIHKQVYPGGQITDFTSNYYPGEALLALCRIYQLDPQPEWLDSAEKGAQWIICVRDKGVADAQLDHDHWLLYALNELYRLRPKELYLNHALRIANAITMSQNDASQFPDWEGSFYNPPRSTPTAIRMEGLCAAYRLARDHGREDAAERILVIINKGIAFLLQTQFQPASALYMQNPQRCLGGIRCSLTNYEIRIDYVQHSISGLLGLYEILNGELNKFVSRVDQKIRTGIAKLYYPLRLTSEDKKFLLNVCYATLLDNKVGENQALNVFFSNIPVNLTAQAAFLCLTIYKDKHYCGSFYSKSDSLFTAAINAAQTALRDQRIKEFITKGEVDELCLTINLFTDGGTVSTKDISVLKKKVELGLHSLTLMQAEKRAFFTASVPFRYNYSLKTTLERLAKKAGLSSDDYHAAETTLVLHNTLQFGTIYKQKEAGQIFETYRYNHVVYQSCVNKESLTQALRLAGDYLQNHVSAEGVITYEYEPQNNKISNPVFIASVLRRIAATWILAEISHYFVDADYKNAAKKSVKHFIDNYYNADDKENFGYLQVQKNINIGLAGFLLLAITAINEADLYPDVKDNLVRFITAMENRQTGCMIPTYLSPATKNLDRNQFYYPGEALTALMTLCEKSFNSAYIDMAERVFPYYLNLFRESPERVRMAAWMSKAYGKLFAFTDDKKYAKFVFEINDYVVSKQRGFNEKYIDKIGCFSRTGSCCGTGVFLESVAEGLYVAKSCGDELRVELYSQAVLMGLRFLLQSQFSHDNIYLYPNKELTLGGFRANFVDTTIRIDTVQHSSCAILKSLLLM